MLVHNLMIAFNIGVFCSIGTEEAISHHNSVIAVESSEGSTKVPGVSIDGTLVGLHKFLNPAGRPARDSGGGDPLPFISNAH